jgi:hypothetical protein
MYKNSVDILGIDNANELFAVRANLEWWETKVNMFWIGQAQHILEWNEKNKSKHVLIGCHGNNEGFCMPTLSKELTQKQVFQKFMKPKDIESFLHFDKSVVVSNACLTGTKEF